MRCPIALSVLLWISPTLATAGPGLARKVRKVSLATHASGFAYVDYLRFVDDDRYLVVVAPTVECTPEQAPWRLTAGRVSSPATPRTLVKFRGCEPFIGNRVVVEAPDGETFMRWDFDGKPLASLPGHDIQILTILAADSTTVIAIGHRASHRGVFVFEEGKPPRETLLSDGNERVNAAALDGSAGRVWIASNLGSDAKLAIWDLHTGQQHSYETSPGECHKLIVLGTHDIACVVYATPETNQETAIVAIDPSGKPRWTQVIHNPDSPVAANADGRSLLVGDAAGLTIVSSAGAAAAVIGPRPANYYTELAVAPGGQTVLAATSDGALTIWSLPPRAK